QLYLQAVEAADREGRESTALAAALGNLGALHSRLGQPAEAEAWLARTLDLRRRLLGPRHWLTALTAKDLGVVQEQQGRIAEALGSTATAAAALGNRCGASGSDPPTYVADLCSDLAVLRRRLERATPTRGAPAPPTTDVAGGHWTQLAARDSAAGAREEIRALGLRFPALLGALPSRVERVDLGDRGTWHRVQYGGFTTRAEAVVLCEALAAAGWGDCFVPRPETAP
ncbi:MAG: tetratricopeptide repeat protein, partial [Acidobacteriota bacterium]